ncbi:MAG: DUF882 domain-containing protein [Bacteroidaceae bacterium]|nr:DUF882 domain-containing protein [Bacteroidaceae bacterium]
MKYFTIDELTRSDTAIARRIDNTPSPAVVENLKNLVFFVLDPLREAYGKPICVNSGYRSPILNVVLSGARNSQHMTGEAVDITSGSKEDNRWLFEYIRNNLPYDQLIDERNYSWIHVSYCPDGGNRQQILRL